jgi:hypothetical protein
MSMELSKQQQKGISNYEAERNKRIEENRQTMVRCASLLVVFH